MQKSRGQMETLVSFLFLSHMYMYIVEVVFQYTCNEFAFIGALKHKLLRSTPVCAYMLKRMRNNNNKKNKILNMRQSDKVRWYSCILSLLIDVMWCDVMLVTDEKNKTIIIVITNAKGI